MKSILLTTTALVAFAGAAVADGHTGVSFGGEATLGYNNDVEDGFYWDADLDVTMSAALDNGVTATATFDFGIGIDNTLGTAGATPSSGPLEGADFVTTSSYVLELSTDTAALRFGDVDPVAEDNWGGVDGATVAGFNDQDAHFDVAEFDAMLVGEVTAAGFTAMLSYGVALDGANAVTNNDVDALQLYVTGDVGMVGLEFAFQDSFGTTPQIIGVAATVSAAGADITGSYITDETETSFGVGVSYPFGPVTLGGYYSLNDVAEDNYGLSADYVDGPISVSTFADYDGATEDWDLGIEGSYDYGNGVTVLAGLIDSGDAYYVAGTYDLGGGAELLVSYADDTNNPINDEIGDPEYMHGTTVQVSFKF